MDQILLVDDSATARGIVSRILGGSYILRTASSGPEALEILATNPPDLVLLDLLMPGMSGFEVLERIRAGGFRVPVLVLSADIQNTTRDRVLSLGAVGMTNKPPRPESLREAVRRALAGERP